MSTPRVTKLEMEDMISDGTEHPCKVYIQRLSACVFKLQNKSRQALHRSLLTIFCSDIAKL